MKVADGVEMLKVTANTMGRTNTIYPTVVWDDETMVLVDAGYPGPLLRGAMEKAGLHFERISKIIITHHDIDHIGGLPGILNELPGKVEVLAHEGEKPYIQGEKRPIKFTPERMAQIEKQLSSLPEDQAKALKAVFGTHAKAGVDKTIADGEKLSYCGGITVIYTPGHTPGHTCLYLNQSKTLVTGDAMNLVDGKLIGPNPEYTYDMDLAMQSLKKLTEYDIENVICYHGGLYKGDANRRIAELANG